MKTPTLKMAATFLAMMPLLTACGGGGGSDGGSNPPPPTGGITRTGDAVAVGPITGFGSVIVNGVVYQTDAATTFIHDDNPSASQDDFAVGETVLIKGRIDDNNGNARATEIEFEDAVEGPVTSVDEPTSTFVVLGQTVRVVATTSFDDSCNIDSLNGLIGFAQVEVSGTADSTGVIEATRIECKTTVGANDLWEVNGIVTNLNPGGATTFQLNDLVVDYSGVTPTNFPSGAIAQGNPVEVKGSTLTGGGALLATSVEYKGARFADDAGDHIEIEGFITRFVSPTNFDVSGIPVKEITGTVYEGGTRGDLDVNLKVEVEGEFDTAGVLNATKIEIKSATAIRVVAALDAVDGNLLSILGITINTDNVKTRFEDKTDVGASPLLPALTPGNYLEVRGQELPAGEITALIVERDDKEARVELRGFVEVDGLDKINRTLRVLNVTISTSAATEYRNESDLPMSEGAFWDAVTAGRLVNVREDRRDDPDPQYQDFPLPGITTIDATELQLELE